MNLTSVRGDLCLTRLPLAYTPFLQWRAHQVAFIVVIDANLLKPGYRLLLECRFLAIKGVASEQVGGKMYEGKH